jgi:hypothetical protein
MGEKFKCVNCNLNSYYAAKIGKDYYSFCSQDCANEIYGKYQTIGPKLTSLFKKLKKKKDKKIPIAVEDIVNEPNILDKNLELFDNNEFKIYELQSNIKGKFNIELEMKYNENDLEIFNIFGFNDDDDDDDEFYSDIFKSGRNMSLNKKAYRKNNSRELGNVYQYKPEYCPSKTSINYIKGKNTTLSVRVKLNEEDLFENEIGITGNINLDSKTYTAFVNNNYHFITISIKECDSDDESFDIPGFLFILYIIKSNIYN